MASSSNYPSPLLSLDSSVSSKVIENEDSISVLSSTSLDSFTNIVQPLLFFKKSNNKNALLILNQPITYDEVFFKRMWENANLKICADGGSTRLFNYNKTFIPDFIIGDLDSVNKETVDFFKKNGTRIILQNSQYATDFDKSVSLINALYNFPEITDNLDNLNTIDSIGVEEAKLLIDFKNSGKPLLQIDIIVVGAVGGRFDQTLLTVSRIAQFSTSKPNLNFLLLNTEHSEFIIFLKKGRNFINYPKLSDAEELNNFGTRFAKSHRGLRNIGLLPLTNSDKISSTGLKWDVTNWETSLLTKFSACNLQVGEEGFIIDCIENLYANVEF